MPSKPLHHVMIATGLSMVACAHSAPSAKEAAMSTAAATSSVRMMPAREWPLRFKSHKFSVFTYDTYGAKVIYAGQIQIDQDDDQLKRSSASYGPDYQRSWSGIHGMIGNFPPPAEVTWRSRDGQEHQAEIDIGALFKDEVIRHNVSREEMADLPDGEFKNEPAIVLEINDRVIRVYMKAFIPTKQPQVPGNANSDARYELVLVKTYSY